LKSGAPGVTFSFCLSDQDRGKVGGTLCALDEATVSKVGTIEVVFKYVHPDGEKRMGSGGSSSVASSGSGFQQANKQDISTRSESSQTIATTSDPLRITCDKCI
jgi:hypothetical protein